jgi:CRP/FNR family transcriptional regulator, cyclic AMP receptor protein
MSPHTVTRSAPSATNGGRVATLPRSMTERRILETTQLLGALPPEALETLRSKSTLRDVVRNEVLFRQGDEASELFGIVSGRVAILTKSPDGRESLVAVLEEGALFGELSLFDEGPRSADARALEATQLLVLDHAAVRDAIEAQPQLLWVIVRMFARRLRATDDSLADAVFLDVPARTAKRLLEIAGDAEQFRLPMTQEDLAGLVGASRERVNKALSLFTKLGWLEVEGRNRYRILDRAALEDRATLYPP